MRHVGSVHSFEPDFKITCGIGGCARQYRNFRSFKKHIHRRHAFVLDESRVDDQHDSDIHCEEEEITRPFSTDNEQLYSSDLKRSAALFLLKSKEMGRVSQVALNSIVSDVAQLFQARVTKLKHEVISALQNSTSTRASDETVTTIDRLFDQEEICNPFSGLEYEYQQKKYFKEELNMLVCWVI